MNDDLWRDPPPPPSRVTSVGRQVPGSAAATRHAPHPDFYAVSQQWARTPPAAPNDLAVVLPKRAPTLTERLRGMPDVPTAQPLPTTPSPWYFAPPQAKNPSVGPGLPKTFAELQALLDTLRDQEW